MRKEGYYFVKWYETWTIAQWLGEDEYTTWGWNMVGSDTIFRDNNFDEIGDKIELPKD